MPHTCCSSRGLAEGFCSPIATNQYAPNKVIEPVHLDIELLLKDLKAKTLHGKVTLTIKHTGKSLVSNQKDLSQIQLNAEQFQDLKISGIDKFHYDGRAIQLYWNTPFQKGEERKVTIDYLVEEPIAGLCFQNNYSVINNTDPIWAITDNETEKARYWLPTVDFPTVRTTLNFKITAPEQFTSLANGSLVGSDTKDGMKTTKWELKYPCPSYLACFAVGDFIEVEDETVDDIPIKYYTCKGYEPADLKRAFDKTPSMIKWLQNKVGVQFPWPKYYQIALPSIGGAMENISLVTWVDTFIQDELFSTERKYVTDLVNIHEMGHTYFGDLLVIKHFEHAWLKESWATYIESCWLQDNVSEDDFRYEMHANAKQYITECTSRYMRPIVTRKYDSSWDLFDDHTYPGGAWRIHMLRNILGDEAFWPAVQSYVEKFSTKTVQTIDFQTSLEESSGLNLNRFFDEFLYSKGFPRFKGDYKYNGADNRVELTISQIQVNEANQIPLFGLDLEVEITTTDGTVITSLLKFDKDASVTSHIKLPQDQKPTQLRVDPHGKILHTLEMPSVDRDVLIGTAKNSKDVVSRIWAYGELVSNGARPSLKAVDEAILNEPFYGVRVACAKTLANLNSEYSLQILAKILNNETHPLALERIISSFHIQSDVLRQSLLCVLERKSLPYRAHGAALSALGSQRHPEDLSYLLASAKDDNKIGQHGIIRAGALKALGKHRSEEGFQYLLTRVESHIEPLRARPNAIQGLGTSAKWQTEILKNQAIETLSKLARDNDMKVRASAISGLIALKAKHTVGSVSTTRSMYANDNHAWLDRKLRSLSNSEDKVNQEAKTQGLVEKLEQRIKKLEEKLALQELKEEAITEKKESSEK